MAATRHNQEEEKVLVLKKWHDAQHHSIKEPMAPQEEVRAQRGQEQITNHTNHQFPKKR